MTRTLKGVLAVIVAVILSVALAYSYGAGLVGNTMALQQAATLTTVLGTAFAYILTRPGVSWKVDPAPFVMLVFGIVMGGIQYVASYFV